MDLDWWEKIATIVGGLSTGLAAIIIIATAIIYGLQLRAIRRANELESVLIVLRYVEEPKLRLARWFVYQHPEIFQNLPDEPIEKSWPTINQKVKTLASESGEDVDLHQIDLVLNTLNDIAYLINNKHVPEKVVNEFLKHTFDRCAFLYADYIKYRQDHPFEPFKGKSDYAKHLMQLVDRLKKNPRETIT
jgi:hypothetical protein